MTIKEIRQQSGLTRKEFCEKLKIPYRTLQDWELGNMNCPDYVTDLIEYYVSHELKD